MEEYEQKAKEFLDKTGTEFSAKFLKNDKYFDEDKESRDIYEVTLKRGEREYKFKFGQSIDSSKFRIRNKATKQTTHEFTRDNIRKGRINPMLFKDKFFDLTSIEEMEYPKEPTPYEVLAALTKYMPDDFEDFCSNYGYDTDSRKAEKTYKAVVDEIKNLQILYNDKEMEILREI